MAANSNQDLMRMISVTPKYQGDRDKKIIAKYMKPIIKADREQDTRQHKGRLVGMNVEMSDGNGQAMYLFSEFMTEKHPIANAIIQSAEAYPEFGDIVLVEEEILKDKGDGSGKFDIIDSYDIYPENKRPDKYQQPFGDPAGVAQAVSSNFGQNYPSGGAIPAPTGASLATAAASQADELGSSLDISAVAKRGQSMYQQSAAPASSVQAQPSAASQPTSSAAVHSSAHPDQAVKSNDLSTPQARQQLIDEIMPDAQSIIDAVSSPMLDVQAKSPNDFLMKSQYEGQLNNMYFMNMDAFGQLQAEHDKLTKELQDFRKKIISNPPAVLNQYQNVKKMTDTIHQDRQRQRKQIAAAYDENLEQLLKSRIEKFKEMYRQKHPDDTEEKLAQFDQAIKPQNDQLDKKVDDARNLAMQQLTQQFMFEHHDDPALQKAFRFMTMKQNMENQFNANQSAMDAMAQTQPAYQPQPQVQQQPSYQAPQQSAPVSDDFSADEDPFTEPQSQNTMQSQAPAAQSTVASTDQVAEMPNDGTGTDDSFDVLDNVNAILDQQAESDQATSQTPADSAAPVGQVPNSDPDFADNSGEAANFTDPEDAVKQQEADLNKETSSDVAHLRSGDTDVAFPNDDQKSTSAKQAAVTDPDFADDGIAPDDLDDDPFDDLDEDVIEDTKKSKKQKHQKKARQKKPAKKKQTGSHKLRKVALGGAVAGILGIGGIAGASHFGLFGNGSSQSNAKSELASGSSKSQKAPKGTIKVGSVLDVTVNGKQIRVKIVQVQSDGSAIGEASDGSRYSISAAQAKQAANAISHEDKNNNQ